MAVRRWLAVLLGCFVGLAAAGIPARCLAAPVVAAASDLRFAMEEVLLRFRAETGLDVRVAYGSSGNLARQIEQGAPFQLFLSADEAYVRRLAERGLTEGEGVLYALGRLVLFAPHGSPIQVDHGFDGLRAALADARVRRFAIANPEHAPYGRAAEEALRSQGLLEAIRPALVIGENVAQAAQFAATGAAQGGIFAYSLALAPELAAHGRFALLPETWHAPLRQRMALVAGAGTEARHLYRYLQQAEARAILGRHGFAVPGDGA